MIRRAHAAVDARSAQAGFASRLLALPLAVAVLAGTGCVVPVPGEHALDVEFMTQDELRDYAEQVFRRQNRTVSRAMGASASDRLSSRALARIERLEQRLNRACDSLNTVASMRSRGEEPGLELENRVRRQIRECDQRTRRLESLLDELDVRSPLAMPSILDEDQG